MVRWKPLIATHYTVGDTSVHMTVQRLNIPAYLLGRKWSTILDHFLLTVTVCPTSFGYFQLNNASFCHKALTKLVPLKCQISNMTKKKFNFII